MYISTLITDGDGSDYMQVDTYTMYHYQIIKGKVFFKKKKVCYMNIAKSLLLHFGPL